MYIDYDNYIDFEAFFTSLGGQYLSPGGAAKKLKVSRQAFFNWIKRDNLITAHRFSGPQGDFVVIPLGELDKIKDKVQSK